MNFRLPSLAALILVASANAVAQDFFDLVEVDEPEQTQTEKKAWQFRGHIQQELKYGTDAPASEFAFERTESGISQVRTETFLELKYIFSEALSTQISAKNEIDWLQWEAGKQERQAHYYGTTLKDAYIDYTFQNDLWLRLGNQVIAWGESEGLSITDVLSTQDFREPGQAELEDIREAIPALMLSQALDSPSGSASLNFVLSYKAGTDRYAESNEDFYPLVAFKKESAVTIHDPDLDKEWEAALQYALQTNGGDYTFVVAEINENTPEILDIQLEVGGSDVEAVEFFQRRQFFYGLSANKVIDSVLLRGEFGILKDRELPTNNLPALSRNKEKRLMFGIEYSGWSDWQVGLEYNYLDRSPIDNPNIDEQSSGFVLRTQYTAMNEKLVSQFWYLKLAEEGGIISRFNISFKPIDNWELNAAYVSYENDKPSSALYPFRNNDTINLALKYGF